MKKTFTRFFILVLAALVFKADAGVKIILVGDSTVTDGAGWGLGFKQFLTNSAECINTSQGGRSSMSFIKEGRWTNTLALKGDYYLIQFGHNDQSGKPGRGTDLPTYEMYMNQYVDDARAMGAKPILVTPLTRRMWQKDNPGKIRPGLQPWADVMKKIATEKKVPLLDLHARSIELCELYGPKGCEFFSPIKGTNADGKLVYDGTHLNSKGTVLFAQLVIDELRKNVPELAPYLMEQPKDKNPVAAESRYNAVVAFDGSGTHTNLQSAINAAPENGTNWFNILIKPGVYKDQVMIPKGKNHIRIIGEEMENTLLTWPYNVFDRKSVSTVQFDPGMVVDANDFCAENVTIENTAGDRGQALALMVNGDRASFNHCRIVGWQDTLMANNGRDYFTNCYVAGRVDFIYGSATAVFDHCEIHSRNGGHVTAASTPQEKPFGFVFLDCKLSGDSMPWVNPTNTVVATNLAKKAYADLGRPWRAYASVAYIRCEMGDHIKPEGWNNWRNPTNELTARFAEYQSSGPGAYPEKRAKWAKQLGDAEAGALTVKKILGGTDAWKPQVDWKN